MTYNNFSRERIWEQIEYDPHPTQMLIHESDARFKVPCCGRRFGKSTSAIADFWPDFLIPRGTYWLVGPTYELGEREFEVLVTQIQNVPAIYNHPRTKISYSPKAGNMSVMFPWQTYVKVVSAEKPKSLQGKGLNGAVMCEAGEHVELTWTRYVRPALADKRGRAIFPSTPKGFNWYWTYWGRGFDPSHDTWASWQFPSWMNTHKFNGTIDDPEIQQMKAEMSDVLFKQEVCAEFTSFEGKVYAEFDEKTHVVDLAGIMSVYLRHWRNYWAVDFGFRDPFVCLDIAVDPEENVYVWREHYESGRATVQHCETLAHRPNPPGFHCDFIAADPSGADGIATMQIRFGHVLGRRVGPMLAIEEIKRVMRGIPLDDGSQKQRFFIDKSCVNLIRELNTFQIKPGETVEEKFTHQNSHSPDALRYWFGEYFCLGAGARLSDVYKQTMMANAGADSFFQYDDQFKLGAA